MVCAALENVFSPDRLDGISDRVPSRQLSGDLLFSTVVPTIHRRVRHSVNPLFLKQLPSGISRAG